MSEEREKRCDALVNTLLQDELECWKETARALEAEVKRLRQLCKEAADYFGAPDPHNETEECADCKMVHALRESGGGNE